MVDCTGNQEGRSKEEGETYWRHFPGQKRGLDHFDFYGNNILPNVKCLSFNASKVALWPTLGPVQPKRQPLSKTISRHCYGIQKLLVANGFCSIVSYSFDLMSLYVEWEQKIYLTGSCVR